MLALVVDDDPVVRSLSGQVLRRAGIGCLGFCSADDALPALSELNGEVGVLVTDIHMPGALDGLGLAAFAWEAHPGLPVIVMSGDSAALRRAAAMPAVIGVLTKPFPPAKLSRLAEGALGRRPIVTEEPN